jgi:hypothetical protein
MQKLGEFCDSFLPIFRAAKKVGCAPRVDQLAEVPLSFPTYAGILVNAAAGAARQLGLTVTWQATHVGGTGLGRSATALGPIPGVAVRSVVGAGP